MIDLLISANSKAVWMIFRSFFMRIMFTLVSRHIQPDSVSWTF